MPSYDPMGLIVAAGRARSWTSDIKFGHNSSVAQSVEAIWAQGGSPLTNSSATIVELTSNNAADHSASSGARTVSIFGVDANFASQSEVISLTGASAASSVGSYLYLHRLKVATAGSKLGNVGVISATLGTGASTFGTIPSGSGQSFMLCRPVPASSMLYMTGIGVAVDKGADVTLRIEEYDQTNSVWRTKLRTNAYQTTTTTRFLPPYSFPSNHVVWVTAKTSNAAGYVVSAWFDYILSAGDA